MNLITRDGKCFISQEDYKILHDLHKKLPQYMDTTELLLKVADKELTVTNHRCGTLSKFRRQLGEIFVTFKSLTKEG